MAPPDHFHLAKKEICVLPYGGNTIRFWFSALATSTALDLSNQISQSKTIWVGNTKTLHFITGLLHDSSINWKVWNVASTSILYVITPHFIHQGTPNRSRSTPTPGELVTEKMRKETSETNIRCGSPFRERRISPASWKSRRGRHRSGILKIHTCNDPSLLIGSKHFCCESHYWLTESFKSRLILQNASDKKKCYVQGQGRNFT